MLHFSYFIQIERMKINQSNKIDSLHISFCSALTSLEPPSQCFSKNNTTPNQHISVFVCS